jgi:hypothetical protein
MGSVSELYGQMLYWARHTACMRGKRNVCKILHSNQLFELARNRRENNIRVDFRENMDWIQVARDKGLRQVVLT